MDRDKLEWDGTYLDCSLVPVFELKGIKYGWIPEYDLDCVYIRRKNLLPVIIDEIKYIFNLKKIGTRYNRKNIFYSPYTVNGVWYEETRLSEIDAKLTYFNLREGRKILAFRCLLGMTSINEKSILFRNGQLYDFNDNTCHEFDEKISLTMRIVKDWFNEIDINKTTLIMIKKPGVKDTVSLILQVRLELTKVIELIDKKYVDLVSTVCNRLIDTIDNVDK